MPSREECGAGRGLSEGLMLRECICPFILGQGGEITGSLFFLPFLIRCGRDVIINMEFLFSMRAVFRNLKVFVSSKKPTFYLLCYELYH